MTNQERIKWRWKNLPRTSWLEEAIGFLKETSLDLLRRRGPFPIIPPLDLARNTDPRDCCCCCADEWAAADEEEEAKLLLMKRLWMLWLCLSTSISRLQKGRKISIQFCCLVKVKKTFQILSIRFANHK